MLLEEKYKLPLEYGRFTARSVNMYAMTDTHTYMRPKSQLRARDLSNPREGRIFSRKYI